MNKRCDYLTNGSDEEKINKLRTSQLKKIKLIKKLGQEKRILLSIIKKHVKDPSVIAQAQNICSRTKQRM